MSTMYETLATRLREGRGVLLDGPMGSELVRRGIRWRKHGLLTDAPAVQQLHEEYARAGADVLRTNTFQLNPRVYLNVFRNVQHMRHIGAPGLEDLVPRLYRSSVKLARQARAKAGKESSVAIAGVLSPLEHCFRPDLVPGEEELRREHEAFARIFKEEGADFLLLESMNTIREARLALAKAVREQRKRAGITQAQLAKSIGSSQSRVAKMEGGDPQASIESLIRALSAIGASIKLTVVTRRSSRSRRRPARWGAARPPGPA